VVNQASNEGESHMTLKPQSKKRAGHPAIPPKPTPLHEPPPRQQEARPSKNGTPITGANSIARHLGFSLRTAHRWRYEFADFPVHSDGTSCVWSSTIEELDAWRANHADLFTMHKERKPEIKEKIRRW